MKGTIRTSVSTSRPQVSWRARRKIPSVPTLSTSDLPITLRRYNLQPFEDPDATFIRSLSYRSSDNHRFDTIHKQITELKKDANKREQEKKEMADVIEQDNLIEIKGVASISFMAMRF